MIRTCLTLVLTTLIAVPALAWETPTPGSDDSNALIEAIRPQAEAALGAPIAVVIEQARVSGDVAFIMVWPQRPGGGKIDLYTTPLALQTDDYFPHYHDGARIDALLERTGATWVARKVAIGVMAEWWSDPGYCETFAPVIPETCS